MKPVNTCTQYNKELLAKDMEPGAPEVVHYNLYKCRTF